MKYVVVIPDGASDYPIEILDFKTPLEAAQKPYMNELAKNGVLGRVNTIPFGFSASSDVANLSLFGYEPQKYYCGRGPLEAANIGIELEEEDIVFRCNLITESDGLLLDYSAGHITDNEAKVLIEDLNKNIKKEDIIFYPGKSYRHLMVYKNSSRYEFDRLNYFPPHDIMGKSIQEHFPKGKNSQILVELMLSSKNILSEHPINKVRIDLKENPANMIWLWSCGKKMNIPSFKERFGLRGAVISAVDLIKGIGRIIGFEVINVKGATGYYDTNYKGKGEAALDALSRVDIVFIHIEAPDEAGHNADLREKITALERIDELIVGAIINGLKGKEYRILITPDHPTPISKRTHTNEPVPFLISGYGIEKGNFSIYSEKEALSSNLYFKSGQELLEYFLKK